MSLINQVKYPHPSCFLSNRAKYGIITSRLFCFARICQLKVDFVERSNKFLLEFKARGYSKSLMCRYVKRFLNRIPLNFVVRHRGSFVKLLFKGI